MNQALAERIIEAAKREDAAWRAITGPDDPPMHAAQEYVDAALALTTEIDNAITMDRMRQRGAKEDEGDG